jgi:hypothetical protein
MTSNVKNLNYKAVDLVESYNFNIKFTSIRVQRKKYNFLKIDSSPTTVAHVSSRRYSIARAPTAAVGNGGRSMPPSPTTLDV